jgi:hypothetical protein
METSLHRQLKEVYARDGQPTEVRLGRYRIDVVDGRELIEIQHASLAAIRDKVAALLAEHPVRVVKPLVIRKRLVKRSGRGQPVVDRRLSPKRGTILDVFEELVYFCRVYPHPNLVLEVPLIEIEEWRYPYRGRRRRRQGGHVVEDQKLLQVQSVHVFRSAADVAALLPGRLPVPFHTGQLASAVNVPRWCAQKMAYCLRNMGVVQAVGKQRNAWLYARA